MLSVFALQEVYTYTETNAPVGVAISIWNQWSRVETGSVWPMCSACSRRENKGLTLPGCCPDYMVSGGLPSWN